LESGDGSTAAGAMVSFGGTASAILTPKIEGESSARVLPTVSAATGTCECDDSGCTFDQCGDAGWSINGTIGISGNTYTVDLELAINTAGVDWAWSYEGEITVTDTLIDGELSGEGGGEITNPNDGSTVSLDWSWSVNYDSVELDSTGCAVGGTLDATVSYSAGSAQGGGNFSGSGSVEFGPTCGTVTAL